MNNELIEVNAARIGGAPCFKGTRVERAVIRPRSNNSRCHSLSLSEIEVARPSVLTALHTIKPGEVLLIK